MKPRTLTILPKIIAKPVLDAVVVSPLLLPQTLESKFRDRVLLCSVLQKKLVSVFPALVIPLAETPMFVMPWVLGPIGSMLTFVNRPQ